jgi:hypothetical protein
MSRRFFYTKPPTHISPLQVIILQQSPSLLPTVDTEAIVCHLAPLSYRAKDPNGNSTLQAMR